MGGATPVPSVELSQAIAPSSGAKTRQAAYLALRRIGPRWGVEAASWGCETTREWRFSAVCMRISSVSPTICDRRAEVCLVTDARSIWYVAAVVAPLLELVHTRIDVEGVPTVDGLSLTTGGDRIVILGGAKVLFEAASGMRVPTHGEIRARGVAARSAARIGLLAGAPCDPPFPAKWTVRDYVTWSARLAGHGPGDARALVEQALAEMKMFAVAGDRLRGAPTQTRRATSIAAALATGADMILLEEPVAGLPDDTARHFARIVLRALGKRAWAVFAARLPLESPFAMDADEAAVVLGGSLVAQGAPAELAARDH